MQTGNYHKAVIRYARNRSHIKTSGSQEKTHIKGVFPPKGHHSPIWRKVFKAEEVAYTSTERKEDSGELGSQDSSVQMMRSE